MRREHVFALDGAHLENPGMALTINVGRVEEMALTINVGRVEEVDANNRSHPNAGNTYRPTMVVSPEAMRPDGWCGDHRASRHAKHLVSSSLP